MPEQDLGRALAALARHAGGTGLLDDAATVRARADRRRGRRRLGTAVAGVVLALALGTGIALAQPRGQHGPDQGPPVVAPSTVSTPGRSTSPSAPPSSGVVASPPPTTGSVTPGPPADDAFSAKRAYRIVPVVDGREVAGAVLTLTQTGHLEIGHDPSAGTLFTTAALARNDNEYMIRVDRKNASRCLSVQGDDTLGLHTCLPTDASVRFRYYQTGRDDQGRLTYAVGFGKTVLGLGRDAYLAWDAAGPIVKDRSGARIPTTWAFVDGGRSTLPG